MKTYLFQIVTLLSIVLVAAGCNLDDNIVSQGNSVDNSAITEGTFAKAARGGTIWADDQLFGTVGTPAHFKAGAGPFDELYNVGETGETFKDGVGAISESKPGDKDFNGGRWHVNLLKGDVPEGKYSDASSVEDLDLNDFTSTDTYFECPLLPRNNRN